MTSAPGTPLARVDTGAQVAAREIFPIGNIYAFPAPVPMAAIVGAHACGLRCGAAVGALGGLVEVSFVVFADLPLGIPDQLVLASVYTVAGAALTNALGGAAGESLSSAGEARTRR